MVSFAKRFQEYGVSVELKSHSLKLHNRNKFRDSRRLCCVLASSWKTFPHQTSQNLLTFIREVFAYLLRNFAALNHFVACLGLTFNKDLQHQITLCFTHNLHFLTTYARGLFTLLLLATLSLPRLPLKFNGMDRNHIHACNIEFYGLLD